MTDYGIVGTKSLNIFFFCFSFNIMNNFCTYLMHFVVVVIVCGTKDILYNVVRKIEIIDVYNL